MSYVKTNHLSNNHFLNFLEYLFSLITILQCDSLYIEQNNSPFNIIVKVSWQIVLLFLVIYLLSITKTKFSSYFILFICLFGSYIIFIFIDDAMVYKFNKSLLVSHFIDLLLLFILFYVLSHHYYINSLFYKFENLVSILSVISLIFWMLSMIGIPTNSINFVKWGTTPTGSTINASIPGYFHIHFITQSYVKFLWVNVIRNTGIFMEASIYSTILIIALFTELFMKKNNKLITSKSLLFLVTIISTTSTSGVLIALAAIGYKTCLIVRKRYSGFYSAFIPIILTVFFLILYVIFINKTSTNIVSSFNIRKDDIDATLRAWREHIIFGNGIGNDSCIKQHMSMWRFFVNGSNTNISVGFTRSLAYGGLILGFFYVIPIIFSVFTSYSVFGISLFIFMLFVLNGLSDFYIFNVILMYIWSRIIIKREKS